MFSKRFSNKQTLCCFFFNLLLVVVAPSSSSSSFSCVYVLRMPPHAHRASASQMKECITSTLTAKLKGMAYQSENASQWSKDIADVIKGKLEGLARTAYSTVLDKGLAFVMIILYLYSRSLFFLPLLTSYVH
jgi:hypothetical protein